MPFTLTTRFVPSIHGFAFPNQFRNQFGPLEFWGRCNGMSWIALDYFNAGLSIPGISDVDFERPIESGFAAALSQDGTIQLFGVRKGDPHDIVGKTVRGPISSHWGRCVEGSSGITPAAVCWAPGRTDLAAIGDDHRLYLCSHEGGPLSDVRRNCSGGLPGFVPLDGETDRQPGLASPFAGRLEVYVVGRGDRALWFRYFDGSWSDWGTLGRPLDREITSGCAAASQYGFMGGYVRGADNAMWAREWMDGDWQPWRSLGGVFTSGPAAASPYPGRVELYGRGTDGAIWLAIREDGTWSGWSSLGAPPGGTREEAPAAVGRTGLLDLFVRGNDDRAWRRTWEGGGWRDWQSVETAITPESKLLTDAIFGKTMTSTVSPLVAATAPLAVGLLFLGPARNYVTWRSPATEQTFRWTVTDELRKLLASLSMGTPIPLGLIAYEDFGHEVVACGLESDSDLPLDSPDLPGPFTYSIRVYDPNHPGCDNVRIEFNGRDLGRPINRESPAIRSSTGEIWRGCFVRDDYRPDRPPL